MPSLEQLKKQNEAEKEAKKLANAEATKQLQEKKDKTYHRKKVQNENFKNFQKDTESKLVVEHNLQAKSAQAFRSALQELRKQFAEVKNNPNSIFAPFFEHDEEGNPVAKLNYKKVLDKEEGIDEAREAHKQKVDQHKKLKNLQTRKNKLNQVVEKSDADLLEKYQETTEYQEEMTKQEREKLIAEYFNKSALQNFVYNTYTNLIGNYARNPESVFKSEIASLVLLDEAGKVKNLRDILRSSIDQQVNSLKEKSHLDTLDKNVKTIEKFAREKSESVRKIVNFEQEAQNFATVMSSVEEFERYYGGKNYILEDVEGLGSFGINLADIKKTLTNDNTSKNEVLNLQLLDREILAREAWMERILKMKDENPAVFTREKVGELHKELLNGGYEIKDSLGLDRYEKYYFETLDIGKFQSLSKAKEFLENKEKALIAGKDLLSNYYNLELTKKLKFSEIVKLRGSHNLENPYTNYGYDNYINSLKREILKNQQTLTDTYVELNNIREARDLFQDKLTESIHLGGRDKLNTMLNSSAEALKKFSREIENKQEELSTMEKELNNLKNKKLGHFESRRKWQANVDEEEGRVSRFRENFIDSKRELNRKIEVENESREAKMLAELFGNDKNFHTPIISELAHDIYAKEFAKNTVQGKEGVVVGEFLEKLQNRVKELEEKAKSESSFYQDLENELNEYKELTEKEMSDLYALKRFFQSLPKENIFNKRSEY